jgi:hypothetical protein
MVTGIKPEESTNRKTEDNLIPPNELIKGLPDYINATIMRGMAVDIHLRFKTDEEFINALTAKAKVLDVNKEKKRRKKKRIYGLSAAVMVIFIGVGIAGGIYSDKLLPNAEITIYYQSSADVDANKEKEKAINEVIVEFQKNKYHKKPKIKAVAFDNLSEIVDMGDETPNIFETTDISGNNRELLDNAESVDNVYKRFPKLVKNTSINDLLPTDDDKQVTFGFYMRAVYTNTESKLTNTTENLNTFSLKKSKYYIGTTLNFYRLNTELNKNLIVEAFTQEKDENEKFIFTDKYSIGQCTKKEKKVADRFLAYCLTDTAQRIFYDSGHLSEAFPINKIQLEKYQEMYKKDYKLFFEQNDLWMASEETNYMKSREK